MKAWQHFKTITRHRRLVRKNCFRIGLYWQGLTHDLSKFHPTEFMVGAKYFQGNKSPNGAERKEKGYSTACFSRCGSFSSPHLILRLLRAGHGISVLYQTVNDGTLREVPLPGFSLRHEYHILWKKGSLFHDRYEALAGELARLCE